MENLIIEKIKKQSSGGHIATLAERFLALGLPTRKNESWKYLNPAPFLENFELVKSVNTTELKAKFDTWKKENLTGNEYFVVLASDELIDSSLPANITLVKNQGVKEAGANDAIESLALMGTNQTYSLAVPAKTQIEKPLILITIGSGIENALTSKVMELNLGKLSELTLIELGLNLGESKSEKQMGKLNINIEDGAKLTHTKIKLDNTGPFYYANTDISLGRDSSLKTVLVALNADTLRDEVKIHLNQNGASAHAFGVYGVNSSETTDINIKMNHNASHTESRQLYKGMIGGDGRGIFTGKIDIKKDAQKVDSAQLSNTLLLTKKAQVFTRPGLEVAADDVKAAHGATVGQLSDDESFYLESRGIPKAWAKLLLSQAFAYEVTEEIADKWAHDYISKNIKRPLLSLLEQKEN